MVAVRRPPFDIRAMFCLGADVGLLPITMDVAVRWRPPLQDTLATKVPGW